MKTTPSFFSHALLGATLLALVLLVSACDSTEPDEDDGAGEQELITRVVLTMTPQGGGEAVTITAEDEDGDGEGLVFDPAELTLQAGTTYDGAIQLFDDENGEEITEEIQEEAGEHLFRYTAGGGLAERLTVTITDTEADYPASEGNPQRDVPVGLEFQVDVSDGPAATGTLNATLFHFDEGAVKEDGDSVSQERDIDINVPVAITATS